MSDYLSKMKSKYCDPRSITAEEYRKRLFSFPKNSYQHWIYRHNKGIDIMKCYLADMPTDGRLVALSTKSQSQGEINGKQKLFFGHGEKIIIVGASLTDDNILYGFKETL